MCNVTSSYHAPFVSIKSAHAFLVIVLTHKHTHTYTNTEAISLTYLLVRQYGWVLVSDDDVMSPR